MSRPRLVKKSDYPFTSCLHPRRVVNVYTQEPLIVPCGQCAACAQNKASRYVFQLNCEATTSRLVYFVTLTFANSFIPRGQFQYLSDDTYAFRDDNDNQLGTFKYFKSVDKLLNKIHLFGDVPYLDKTYAQRFLKRLRSRLEPYRFRYFLVGEYGPEHFRPHFHLLLFTDNPELSKDSGHKLGEFPKWQWSKNDKQQFTEETPLSLLEYHIRKSWPFGSSDLSQVIDGNPSKYVASYVNSSGTLPSCYALQSVKPFCTHSRFLGRSLFRKELVETFESTPDDLVTACTYINGEYNEVRLSAPYYSAMYPRTSEKGVWLLWRILYESCPYYCWFS